MATYEMIPRYEFADFDKPIPYPTNACKAPTVTYKATSRGDKAVVVWYEMVRHEEEDPNARG